MKKKLKFIGISMLLTLLLNLNVIDLLNQPSKIVFTESLVASDDLPIYIGMFMPRG